MCVDQNELSRKSRSRKKQQAETDMTIGELLSAISENEYPQYILEAITTVREWMNDMISRPDEIQDEPDILAELFGSSFHDETGGLENLFERLKAIEEYADVIPNPKMPGGKPDTLIISITPSDYESGLRTAIDYAAVFNRSNCRRVWIISDTFIFDEVARFVPHVDALAAQGITLRFILVTPWGWVELPLSAAMASKRQFLWRTKGYKNEKDDTIKRRRRKE